MRSKLFLLQLTLLLCGSLLGQSPFYSEAIIKYDLNTHQSDKPIPFDRSFTLIVEKMPIKTVKRVLLFEAAFTQGSRALVNNILDTTRWCKCLVFDSIKRKKHQAFYHDTINRPRVSAVMDIELLYKLNGDTLQIYVPPLKPNKVFDINVVGLVSEQTITKLLKINALWAEVKELEAQKEYAQLRFENKDPFTSRSYLATPYDTLKNLYDSKLDSVYKINKDISSFHTTISIELAQIQALIMGYRRLNAAVNDGHYIIKAIQDALLDSVQLGLYDIKSIYQKESRTTMYNLDSRRQNLLSSIVYFDSLHQKANQVLGQGVSKVRVGSDFVFIDDVINEISHLRFNLQYNYNILNKGVVYIVDALNALPSLRNGHYLAANTVSSDLKTAGGNILFLDLGLTNIMLANLRGKMSNVPRLYWGASIYFRPIDKNTRRNRFVRDFDPARNCGESGNVNTGPDYGALSRWSIWQRLCLNIGFTIGGLQNSEYDNLYNNTSLLIGPAYRFARAFKVSAGFSLLKGTSKNPLISEKKIVGGGYISLSTDVDFIQSLKDLTSILTK